MGLSALKKAEIESEYTIRWKNSLDVDSIANTYNVSRNYVVSEILSDAGVNSLDDVKPETIIFFDALCERALKEAGLTETAVTTANTVIVTAAGIWAGCKLGATIGAAAGPWGAAIGGVVGGGIGLAASLWGSEMLSLKFW